MALSSLSRVLNVKNVASLLKTASIRPIVVTTRASHGHTESDAELDKRYEDYFNDPNIDGWGLRQGINDLQGYDLVPEPKIIIAAMKACRRVNDYALAVRYLEAIKDKCGPRLKQIWPFLLKEVGPTLKELGILTPEEMGYDKPELAYRDTYDM